MRIAASVLLVGAVGIAGVGTPPEARAVRKCASHVEFEGYSAEHPLVVIDGRRTEVELTELDPRGGDIGWFEVGCWDPVTGSLGAAAGVPTVYVVTRRTVDATTAAVDDLVRAQAKHFDARGRYAEGPSELGMAGGPVAVRVERADDGGWSASVSPWGVAWECRVSSRPGGTAGAPRCLGLRELADEGRDVRASWEAP